MKEESNKQLATYIRDALNRQHAPTGKWWGVIISTELANEVADRLEKCDHTGLAAETLGDLLKMVEEIRTAEKEGRLLVLPCAIGTPVFVHERLCVEGKCAKFIGCKFAPDCMRDAFIKCPLRVVKRAFTYNMRKGLGITFWLTEAEAEAAIPADRRP